jgi:hypothetical protein
MAQKACVFVISIHSLAATLVTRTSISQASLRKLA